MDKLDELNKIYNPDPTQYDNYNNYLARLKEELKNSGGSSSESNHIKKRSTYPEKTKTDNTKENNKQVT